MARTSYIASATEVGLRELISTKYPASSQLPSERDLAEELNASRSTLREVVSSMVRSGELVRKWGIGTFVASPVRPYEQSLNVAAPLRDRASEQGFVAEFTNWTIELQTADPETAAALQLSEGVNVWRVSRVLELDGYPSMRIIDWVPTSLNGRELHFDEFGHGETVDFIPFVQQETGLLMTRIDARIAIVNASAEDAALLQIDAGTAMILTLSGGFTADHLPVTKTRTCHVPGRVEIHVSTSEPFSDITPTQHNR